MVPTSPFSQIPCPFNVQQWRHNHPRMSGCNGNRHRLDLRWSRRRRTGEMTSSTFYGETVAVYTSHVLRRTLTSTTRNNGFKIIVKRFRSNDAKHFFFNRIVNVWNSFPAQIVNSITIESFKKKLDKHLASVHQIEYFILAHFFSSFIV